MAEDEAEAPAPKVCLIVAVAENGVMGRGGKLPWRLPADLRRFRELTMGHHVVMGRRTFQSLPGPLDGRRILVLSRQGSDASTNDDATDDASTNASTHASKHASTHARASGAVERVGSIQQAVVSARRSGDTHLFVAGGRAAYGAAYPLATHLYLTQVHASLSGDVTFPFFPVPEKHWRETWRHLRPKDSENPLSMTFLVYKKRPGVSSGSLPVTV